MITVFLARFVGKKYEYPPADHARPCIFDSSFCQTLLGLFIQGSR